MYRNKTIKHWLIIVIGIICGTFVYRNQKFGRADAFVGYQNDTPAAVVFQATYSMSELQQQLREKSATNHFILDLARLSAEAFVAEKEGSEVWSEAVSLTVVLQLGLCLVFGCHYDHLHL